MEMQIQPPIMPRPDLEALNVNYRRIPLLSIGRDMYVDSRFILHKLETLLPSGALGAKKPEHRAIERLLDRFTTDAGMFTRAAQLIPTDLPNMRDPKFRADRTNFGMHKFDVDAMDRMRPEAVVMIRDCFELMETTILSDGREWVFGGDGPSLGDIEAVWLFHWLVDMKGAVPESVISATTFPKVFAWVKRFDATVKKAQQGLQTKPTRVKGPEVAEYMKTAKFAEAVGEVDVNDPLGLRVGDVVEVWPIESGFSHKDRGKLLSLTPREVVISKTMRSGEEIRVHAQRWGFRIRKVEGGEARL
jgi:hypothetical protein